MSEGMVFVQSNGSSNAVLAFRRSAEGALAPAGTIETGGAGSAEPHLPSQGSVTLTGDGRYLLVANAGSDDVSVFAVDDGLTLVGRTLAGAVPRSVAEHDGVICVLSVGDAIVRGFRLGAAGLEPIAGAEYELSSPAADPAQVGFSPDGATLIVTERGANAITVFEVQPGGTLANRRTIPSSGPTPYGFALTSGGTLVVTEAFGAERGAAATSSYVVSGGEVTPVTKSAGNGRSEICWAVVTPDDRYAYTTNFADGAVSCYSIAADGALTLEDPTAGITEDGRPGLRDECLAGDGSILYALDADSGHIFGWRIGEGGGLTAVGSWGGLPLTAAGLAAT